MGTARLKGRRRRFMGWEASGAGEGFADGLAAGMGEARRVAIIPKTGGQLRHDPGALLHLAQQQTAGGARDRSTAKPAARAPESPTSKETVEPD